MPKKQNEQLEKVMDVRIAKKSKDPLVKELPTLIDYLATILPVFALAGPTKRKTLLDHNPILKQMVDVFDDAGLI